VVLLERTLEGFRTISKKKERFNLVATPPNTAMETMKMPRETRQPPTEKLATLITFASSFKMKTPNMNMMTPQTLKRARGVGVE
jgi:hypothetical protein